MPRTRFSWLVFCVVTAGCLPTPNDWTGGLEGDYYGTMIYSSEDDEDGRSSSYENKTSMMIRIESGADGVHGYVFGLDCGGLPVTWSPMGLELEESTECEDVSGSGTSSYTTKTEWTELTITRSLPDGIELKGEYTTEYISSGTTNTDDPDPVTVSFTGVKRGGE